MLDVNKRLGQLYPSHLPAGFDARKGVARLFPKEKHCMMSSMDGAVHNFGTASASTPSGEVSATYVVMADWCGNWFFDFYVVTEEGSSGNWGAGFLFDYSNDGVGHGYTITGNYSNADDIVGCTNQMVTGNDPWIVENWNALIAQGFRVGVGNDTGGLFGSGTPDIVSYTLEGSSFSTLQNLAGANPSSVNQGANVEGSCWYDPNSAWGIPPYTGYQAGKATAPAEGIDLPGPYYPWGP